MEQWKSVDEILDFAIGQEEQAAHFYTDLSGRMDRPWMSEIFKEFAKEEMWHKSKLLEVKSGKRLIAAEQKVLDLKIGDYLVDVEPTDHMDYQQALVVAMKRRRKPSKCIRTLPEPLTTPTYRQCSSPSRKRKRSTSCALKSNMTTSSCPRTERGKGGQ